VLLRAAYAAAACLGALLAAAGCSSSSDAPQVIACAVTGGPAAGEADGHCTVGGVSRAQPTSEASCSAADPDGHAHGRFPTSVPLFGAEGDDEDCKYHLAWSSTPICQNTSVHFTVSVTRKADGTPMTGDQPYVDATLDNFHIAPNLVPSASETTPGTYRIGPILFDLPGRWAALFHLRPTCSAALPDSPHARVAFYVDVP
jgi:hypothetical protein